MAERDGFFIVILIICVILALFMIISFVVQELLAERWFEDNASRIHNELFRHRLQIANRKPGSMYIKLIDIDVKNNDWYGYLTHCEMKRMLMRVHKGEMLLGTILKEQRERGRKKKFNFTIPY